MRISIIVPVLNEASGIVLSLQRLQYAREVGHEIVLVDGGSADETVALANPLVDHAIQAQAGRAAQMNQGAQHAGGDIFWFVHADTDVHRESIKALLAGAEGSGSAEFWGRFDVRIDSAAWPYRVIEFMMNLRSRLTSVATGDQGIFVSRALFLRIGGFAAMPLMEDIELSKRLRKVIAPVCVRRRITTSARRWQQSGLTRTILLMWWLRLAYVCGVPVDRLARWYRPGST